MDEDTSSAAKHQGYHTHTHTHTHLYPTSIYLCIIGNGFWLFCCLPADVSPSPPSSSSRHLHYTMKLSSLPVALLSLAGLSAAASRRRPRARRRSTPRSRTTSLPSRTRTPAGRRPSARSIRPSSPAPTSRRSTSGSPTWAATRAGPERFSLPFRPSGRTRYAAAALESLSLSSYDFGDTEAELIGGLPIPWDEGWWYEWQCERLPRWLRWWLVPDNTRRWLAWRLLPPAQRRKTSVELWVDAMDFSRVRNLSIADGACRGQTVSLYLELASECRRQKTNDGDHGWGEGVVRRMNDDHMDNNGTDDEAAAASAAAAACTGLHQYAMPLLSAATSREVAEFLRANGMTALEQLTLYAGTWRLESVPGAQGRRRDCLPRPVSGALALLGRAVCE
ncbi:hypothetical protein CTA2_7081 [Colletotrichum tanaceti]|uniref:Uncharacterized protein n=1 Tax=Colletotrichum tanaceti TaxID=1306861 RepID=A0A4U6X0F2_9PEZI|nr:hypothetical protein CTA2_7081 [Colletotrichum tanaceti]TKW48852.1 hypothetical protein CTA1_1827 [Colletotrichum tanaceti]